jgi:hypothetical protein
MVDGSARWRRTENRDGATSSYKACTSRGSTANLRRLVATWRQNACFASRCFGVAQVGAVNRLVTCLASMSLSKLTERVSSGDLAIPLQWIGHNNSYLLGNIKRTFMLDELLE